MSCVSRFGVATVIAACAFGIVNYFNLSRRVTCYDCFFPYGLPFKFFEQGGEGGGGGLVWTGAVGDLIAVLAVGALVGWVWNRIFPTASR